MQLLFGGSFDPVHRGHLAMADHAQEALAAEQVIWLPTPGSPLKAPLTANHHRLALLHALLNAEATNGRWQISTLEFERPAPAYSIDTLRTWRARVGADKPLVFMLGTDSWQQLAHWRGWSQLTDYAHLLVVSRPTDSHQAPDALRAWLKNRETTSAKLLQSQPCGRVMHLHTPHYPISSTELRCRLRAGEDCREWLSPAQLDYIAEHQLYRSESTPRS